MTREEAVKQPKGTDDAEWFEISDRDYLEPHFRGRKLKLLADEQVPGPIVRELRAAKIAIDQFAAAGKRISDTTVLHWAEQQKRVLLTLDADFWDDHKHPLHELRTGIIYVAESPADHDRILRAFGLVYGCFAKNYPLDWWNQMKARATVGEFELRIRNRESKVVGYRFKLHGTQLLAREV